MRNCNKFNVRRKTKIKKKNKRDKEEIYKQKHLEIKKILNINFV